MLLPRFIRRRIKKINYNSPVKTQMLDNLNRYELSWNDLNDYLDQNNISNELFGRFPRVIDRHIQISDIAAKEMENAANIFPYRCLNNEEIRQRVVREIVLKSAESFGILSRL